MLTAPPPSNSTQNRATAWLIAIGYVGLIYATLGVVRAPLAYLRSHGVLRSTLAVLFLTCWLGVLGLLRSRSRQIWRFVAMIAIAGVYALVARRVGTPEEQLHFIQYGLVGVLFARAVRPTVRHEGAAYALAFVLACLAGWLDEVLQGHLPTRHYDVHDIALNAVSAFLGLTVYRIIPRRQETLVKSHVSRQPGPPSGPRES